MKTEMIADLTGDVLSLMLAEIIPRIDPAKKYRVTIAEINTLSDEEAMQLAVQNFSREMAQIDRQARDMAHDSEFHW